MIMITININTSYRSEHITAVYTQTDYVTDLDQILLVVHRNADL